MKNIALIIAGGVGARMGQDIPKQFINVYDKPVLIYTLESFQRHPQVDAIEVVCIDGWHDILWAYAKQFNIDKLKWVISGGKTGQESIRNGVFHLEGKVNPDDNIIIHRRFLSQPFHGRVQKAQPARRFGGLLPQTKPLSGKASFQRFPVVPKGQKLPHLG